MLKLDWTDETPFSSRSSVLRAISRSRQAAWTITRNRTISISAFGFLYYGLMRAAPAPRAGHRSGLRLQRVICPALGLGDNNKGKLSFVDPSHLMLKHGPFRTIGGTAQWGRRPRRPGRTSAASASSGWSRTKQAHERGVLRRLCRARLPEIDLAFIDGSHT